AYRRAPHPLLIWKNVATLSSTQARRSLSSNVERDPDVGRTVGSTDDTVLEVYDFPTEKQFEEDPEFDYVSQSTNDCKYPFISATRSSDGVFSITELVKFLAAENVSNVVVISLPEYAHYGEFMVVASAKSRKHISQVSDVLRRLFKIKRSPSDPMPSLEGLKEQSDWVAVDLGNILLHLFATPELRQKYDLESLWGAGPDFDEQAQGLDASERESTYSSHAELTQADWERIVEDIIQQTTSP
ncbi:unnamed protein product, partial [Mesocestoides corti]